MSTYKKDRKNKPSSAASLSPTKSRASHSTVANKVIFGRENYKWILLGVGLIIIGMMLMSGGANTDPNVWDEELIYGFRRTTLAPIVILTGLGVEIYAIFK